MEYRNAIIDECGNLRFLCSELEDYEIKEILELHPKWKKTGGINMKNPISKEVLIELEKVYGNLDNNCGCYINGEWLSVKNIVKLIEKIDTDVSVVQSYYGDDYNL